VRKIGRAGGVGAGSGLASMTRCFLGFIALALAVGCGPERSVSLLELRASGGVIDLGVVERGTQLSIKGRGFPVGGAGVARFIGTLRAPGQNARRIERVIEVSAVTGEELVAPGDALIAELGGRGTFEGLMRVEFRAALADAVLTAEQPVIVDVSALAVHEQHALRARALMMLERLGIEISEDATTHEGVLVSGARAGSHAEQLGLQAGDVIERAAGVRVHALGDLVPPPLASSLELRGRRSVMSGPWAVHVPLDASVETSALPLGKLAWLIGWALGLGLVFGHRESLANRALSMLRDAIDGRLVDGRRDLGVFGAELPPARGRRLRPLLALLASFCGVMLVTFEPAGFLSVRSITLYLPIVAVGVALACMRHGKSARERGREAALILGRMTVMGAVLACGCALSGTRALDGIVAPQGAWPWQWGALQHPALLAALPLFLVYGAQIGDADPHAGTDSKLVARLMTLERVLTNVVLAAFGAAIFFGGWQSPLWMTLGPWPERLPGALMFVLKAWAVAFALASARKRGAALRKRTTVTLCTALIVLTSIEVLAEPSPSLSRFTGELLSVAILSAAVLLGAQRMFARRYPRPALSIVLGAK
jgi:hypothetical protein